MAARLLEISNAKYLDVASQLPPCCRMECTVDLQALSIDLKKLTALVGKNDDNDMMTKI